MLPWFEPHTLHRHAESTLSTSDLLHTDPRSTKVQSYWGEVRIVRISRREQQRIAWTCIVVMHGPTSDDSSVAGVVEVID